MEYPFKDLMPLDEVLEREGYYKDWTHLDPEVFYSLTQISEYIKTKGYGVDVRLLIAQLAEHFGLKTTQVVDLANLLKDQFDVVIRDATSGADWGGEIVLARGGKSTLGKRLDETTTQLAQKATKDEVRENTNIRPINVAEMDTETKQLFTGGAVAVVGEDAVGTENIKEKAVTPELTNFINVSNNLFNKNTVKPNTSVNGSGEEYTVAGSNLSEFIKVEAGGQYTLNTPSTDFILFSYTENKTYINQVLRTGTFTIIANAGWVRLRVRNADLAQAQLNKGNVLLPYEQGYTKLSEQILFDVKPYQIVEPIPSTKRTLLGESVKIMTVDLPNIKDRKLIFGAGNLRVMYRNTFDLFPLSEPLELPLSGEHNHIYFDTISKSFQVFTAVAHIPQATENSLRIGYVQYANISSLASLKNVSLPFEFQIDDVPVAVKNLNDRITSLENNTGAVSDDDMVHMEEIPTGYYQSNTTSDYTSENHYNDTITLEDVYGGYDSIVNNHYGSKTVPGKDASGNYDINVYRFKPDLPTHANTMKPIKLIFITNLHGEEKSSTISLRDFMLDVANNWQNNKLLEFVRFNVDLVIVPVANPWGFTEKRRWNRNKVDLNRNFSRFWEESGSTNPEDSTYKGAAPLSEIESQYIRDLIQLHSDADALFDYHMNGTSGNEWQYSFWHSFSGHNENLGRYNDLVKVSLRNITSITREAQKNYTVPPSSGFLGYQSKTTTKMSTLANYAYGQSVPAFTIECMKNLVGETAVYSNDTLQLCTSFIGNHILNVARVFYGSK